MRFRLAVGALLQCGMCALGVPASAAVGDYLGRPVASVRLTVEGRISTEPALLQLVETRVGQPLRMADVRETLTHLFSLGRFDDVRVDATTAGAGVALAFELSPNHPVTAIAFEGQTRGAGIDVGQLRRTVVDRYGSSPLLLRAADMARMVTETLHERGYRHAAVRVHANLRHDPDQATLVFTLDPGARTLVGAIDVVGAPTVPREVLLKELGLAPGGPYEAPALTEHVERYVASVRARGFFEASLVPSVRFADEERVANLTLTVNPGPHVRLVFAGDSLPSDRRSDLVPIEREGSVDEDLLEDASNRIEEELKGQGYRDAAAPHTREESNGERVVTFTVRRGPLYRVERVEIGGNAAVPIDELQSATRLRDGQPFSESRLDSDIGGIEELYRRRGFPAVKAQSDTEVSAPVAGASYVPVTVRITIREGVRAVVGPVRIEGNASVPEATLRQHLGLQAGEPYRDAQLRADADAMQSAYATLGYQNATVTPSANVAVDGTRADPVFTVREGPRLVVDHVLIVGNVRTKTRTIERELQFKTGDPLNTASVNESQRRLAALGLFRRVRITQLHHGEESRRDLLVTVEEAPATTVGYGGGFEVRLRAVQSDADPSVAAEQLEIAPRASFEIGRRNLFGTNRSVNLFTSLSLHPRDSSIGGYGFTEYRAIGTFREPRLADTSLDALITGTLEQQIRTSFNFARRGVTVEVGRRVASHVSVTGSYQIQRTRVFDANVAASDLLLIQRLFPDVRLSSFAISGIRDTRDDPVDSAAGSYVSLSGQLAARSIGSEVGFTKTFVTAQLFRVVPRTKRLVLAGSARLGLADAFPRTVGLAVVEDLPISERFFAGGDSTVRGYALDTLGTAATKDGGFPLGGNALMIFNAEARVPVWRGLGLVAFVDSGNVFANPTDLDLGALKTAVGLGVRYKSPVGPIRIDVGFKLKRDELSPGVREGLTALHISLGQAF